MREKDKDVRKNFFVGKNRERNSGGVLQPSRGVEKKGICHFSLGGRSVNKKNQARIPPLPPLTPPAIFYPKRYVGCFFLLDRKIYLKRKKREGGRGGGEEGLGEEGV